MSQLSIWEDLEEITPVVDLGPTPDPPSFAYVRAWRVYNFLKQQKADPAILQEAYQTYQSLFNIYQDGLKIQTSL